MIARIGATSIAAETTPDRVVSRDLIGRVQTIIATTTREQVDAGVGEDPLCHIARVQDHVRVRSNARGTNANEAQGDRGAVQGHSHVAWR